MSFKDQLMTALHDAVAHFNESGDPNAAVVKSAQDHDFNAEQTQRLIETFNTARTIYHYKSAADRSANFELANRDDVLASLFGAQPVKTAEVQPLDTSEYSRPVRRYLESEPAEKQAESEPVPVIGVNLENLTKEAMLALTSKRQEAAYAADEARIASVKAAGILHDVSRSFAYGEQTDRLARLCAGYADDPELGAVVAKFAEFVPAHRSPIVEQLVRYQGMHVVDDSDLGVQVGLLKEAKQLMEREVEMLAISGTLQKEADEFERNYAELFSDRFPVEQTAADLIKIADTETLAKQKYTTSNMYGEPVEVESTSGQKPKDDTGLAGMIAANTYEGAKAPVQKFLETGVDRAFTQPSIEENKKLSERMKNVQRQILLQDLIVNDPVLSDQSPETVAEAYNSLLQLAPEVAANKEIVRAILRQTVNSVAVSPYDAEMWTKLEQSIRAIKGKGMPAKPSEQQGAKR